MPEIHAVLGLFIPLIIVNCIVLGRVEVAFLKMRPALAVSDALGYGLGFTWALTLIGAIRELLAAGTVFGAQVLPSGFTPWQIMQTPPGAFLTMGLLYAAIRTVRSLAQRRRSDAASGKELQAA